MNACECVNHRRPELTLTGAKGLPALRRFRSEPSLHFPCAPQHGGMKFTTISNAMQMEFCLPREIRRRSSLDAIAFQANKRRLCAEPRTSQHQSAHVASYRQCRKLQDQRSRSAPPAKVQPRAERAVSSRRDSNNLQHTDKA